MKSIKIFAAAIIFAALAACGGQAQAQVLPKIFSASNGNVFTTHDIRSIEFTGGQIILTYTAGGISTGEFPDNAGIYAAKVKASPGFYDQFVQVGTSQRYVNVTQSRWTLCNNGHTMMVWQQGQSEDFNGDGCALHQAIKARAN